MEAVLRTYDVNENYDENFKTIAMDTVRFLATSGIKVSPFKPGIPFFSALPDVRKVQVLKLMRFYRDLCADQINEGYEIKDSTSFTWRALRSLELTPPADLFTHIRETDIIEIYSSEGVQLFRNFRFFEFCSFSLEELFCREWFHLYERDERMFPKILEAIERTRTENGANGFAPDIPMHIVAEKNSEENIVMNYKLNWIAPVYHNRSHAGFLSVEEAHLLEGKSQVAN